MKNKHPFWTKLDWRGARPLTLRELIMKSNFQTMMKYIIAFDKKMANQGNHFCRACECIRDMKVKAHSEDYILAEYDSKYNEPSKRIGKNGIANADKADGRIVERNINKTTHYGKIFLHRLSRIVLHPHRHGCAMVGLAHLYRRHFVMDCDLGIE